MSKTIVWDFDYTLFDAATFKQDLEDAVTAQGVTPEQFRGAYLQVVKREGKTHDYDPDAHLELLADYFSASGGLEAARAGIDEALADTNRYLYNDVEKVLAEIREAGDRNVLVTLGNRGWQQAKVTNSGIEHLFDQVITVDEGKAEAIAGFAKEGEVVVVNDNGREMAAIREAVPDAEYILVDGPKGKPEGLDMNPVQGVEGIEAALGLVADADPELSQRYSKRL